MSAAIQSVFDWSAPTAAGGPRLRPYQIAAVEKRNELKAAGVKSVLIVAPTGSGKTVIAAEIVRQERDTSVLFLAPRRELIHQTCRKLDDVGVTYGVLLAGDRRTNLYEPVQVASVDTLVARVLRSNKLRLPDFKTIIIDEAHVGLTKRRRELLSRWADAQLVGLTATPCRADGRALGQLYDELINVATVRELTEQGFLVKARYFSVSEPDLSGVRTTAGDYNRHDIADVMDKPELTGDIVEHWLRHAAARRTVVFASSIRHSAALTREFISHGVSAEHVDARTPQDEREAIFGRFASGRTQVLTNCTLASIGFDLPELDCVVFARPTKSLGLYLQMLGRGLRPAAGKSDCLVLDHAGNVRRHGFATDHRFWTLHGKYATDAKKEAEAKKADREKGEEPEALKCPECSCMFSGTRQCPACGYAFPPIASPVKVKEGTLVELLADDYPMEKVWGRPELMERFYYELVGYAQMRNYKLVWAAHKFKERTGYWPTQQMQVAALSGSARDPSVETVRWVKSKMIAWAREQEKKRLAAAHA